MYQRIRFAVYRESGRRKLLNALLALATGTLAFLWPNFLYYIVGGYLIALSLILFFFRVSNFLTALSALTALLIFIFPELIPYSFAFFLGVFGLTLVLTMNLMLPGLLTLLFAALILSYPGSVAYMIGVFLILYGLTHLINLIRESRSATPLP
ncbi:MAG: hypothetical protein WD599_06285 [Balneolaceae bacterium]